ncbi:hypothetical protein MYU51_021819 [Penicillium brevicompactum]|uniref:uncharacterized protein n=1 Tax=Penicillium brevicompactum TaxID=5074 RepID=UPI00253F83A9|nr:uncharacterized protein N7506_003472 [Penicillium brevicompactum]KAJ5343648.1 hypothetical protein N7506_003472 [Penicillium brevicompactum]
MLFSQLILAAATFSMNVASLAVRADTRDADLYLEFSNKLNDGKLRLTNAEAKSGKFHADHVNDALTTEQIAHYAFPPGEQHAISIDKTVYPAYNQYVARVEGSLDIYNEAIQKTIAHVYFYANSSVPAADYILDVSDVVDGYKVTPKGGEHNPRFITFNIEN